MLQPIKYQYVAFLVLSVSPKLAKNAPTICFLIFCALLSGQTDKYSVMAKGVPRVRGEQVSRACVINSSERSDFLRFYVSIVR